MQPSPRLLAVCGSLQARSANRAALDVATSYAAQRGAGVTWFDRLADIPAFDPDRECEAIDAVDDWRRQVEGADALLVAAPEYAGAIAGAVKNAFDWLVGSGSVYRKPIAVMSAGTSGGVHARRMLIQTLTWQGAYVVAELGVAAPRTKLDDAGRIVHPPTLRELALLVDALVDATTLPSGEQASLARGIVGSLGIEVAHIAPAG